MYNSQSFLLAFKSFSFFYHVISIQLFKYSQFVSDIFFLYIYFFGVI